MRRDTHETQRSGSCGTKKARECPGGQKEYLKHSLEILGQGAMITVRGDSTDAVGPYAGGCAACPPEVAGPRLPNAMSISISQAFLLITTVKALWNGWLGFLNSM